MGISEKERRIYLALHMHADRPLSDVARECGYREHTVRHAVQAMAERALFQTELVVDEARLGLHHYRMFFNVSPGPKNSLRDIEQTFTSDPIVAFMARVSGEYRHCVAFYVHDFSQIEVFLDRIQDRFGAIIARKLIARLTGWTYFGKKYLIPHWKPRHVLQTGYVAANHDLSPTDRLLLSLLNASPLSSVAQISRRAGLPVSTAKFRLARLKKLRIIGPPLHRMHLSAANVHAFFALVRTCFPSRKFATALFDYAAAHPNIIEFFQALGGWDYELFIEAEEPSVMHRITQELETFFPDYIESVSQLTRLDDVKWIADFQPILTETCPISR